nr:hypothetical protein CFP56_67008 [Quercus suber]
MARPNNVLRSPSSMVKSQYSLNPERQVQDNACLFSYLQRIVGSEFPAFIVIYQYQRPVLLHLPRGHRSYAAADLYKLSLSRQESASTIGANLPISYLIPAWTCWVCRFRAYQVSLCGLG